MFLIVPFDHTRTRVDSEAVKGWAERWEQHYAEPEDFLECRRIIEAKQKVFHCNHCGCGSEYTNEQQQSHNRNNIVGNFTNRAQRDQQEKQP